MLVLWPGSTKDRNDGLKAIPFCHFFQIFEKVLDFAF